MSSEHFHEGGCQCGAIRFRTSDQALLVIARRANNGPVQITVLEFI